MVVDNDLKHVPSLRQQPRSIQTCIFKTNIPATLPYPPPPTLPLFQASPERCGEPTPRATPRTTPLTTPRGAYFSKRPAHLYSSHSTAYAMYSPLTIGLRSRPGSTRVSPAPSVAGDMEGISPSHSPSPGGYCGAAAEGSCAGSASPGRGVAAAGSCVDGSYTGSASPGRGLVGAGSFGAAADGSCAGSASPGHDVVAAAEVAAAGGSCAGSLSPGRGVQRECAGEGVRSGSSGNRAAAPILEPGGGAGGSGSDVSGSGGRCAVSPTPQARKDEECSKSGLVISLAAAWCASSGRGASADWRREAEVDEEEREEQGEGDQGEGDEEDGVSRSTALEREYEEWRKHRKSVQLEGLRQEQQRAAMTAAATAGSAAARAAEACGESGVSPSRSWGDTPQMGPLTASPEVRRKGERDRMPTGRTPVLLASPSSAGASAGTAAAVAGAAAHAGGGGASITTPNSCSGVLQGSVTATAASAGTVVGADGFSITSPNSCSGVLQGSVTEAAMGFSNSHRHPHSTHSVLSAHSMLSTPGDDADSGSAQAGAAAGATARLQGRGAMQRGGQGEARVSGGPVTPFANHHQQHHQRLEEEDVVEVDDCSTSKGAPVQEVQPHHQELQHPYQQQHYKQQPRYQQQQCQQQHYHQQQQGTADLLAELLSGSVTTCSAESSAAAASVSFGATRGQQAAPAVSCGISGASYMSSPLGSGLIGARREEQDQQSASSKPWTAWQQGQSPTSDSAGANARGGGGGGSSGGARRSLGPLFGRGSLRSYQNPMAAASLEDAKDMAKLLKEALERSDEALARAHGRDQASGGGLEAGWGGGTGREGVVGGRRRVEQGDVMGQIPGEARRRRRWQEVEGGGVGTNGSPGGGSCASQGEGGLLWHAWHDDPFVGGSSPALREDERARRAAGGRTVHGGSVFENPLFASVAIGSPSASLG